MIKDWLVAMGIMSYLFVGVSVLLLCTVLAIKFSPLFALLIIPIMSGMAVIFWRLFK